MKMRMPFVREIDTLGMLSLHCVSKYMMSSDRLNDYSSRGMLCPPKESAKMHGFVLIMIICRSFCNSQHCFALNFLSIKNSDFQVTTKMYSVAFKSGWKD